MNELETHDWFMQPKWRSGQDDCVCSNGSASRLQYILLPSNVSDIIPRHAILHDHLLPPAAIPHFVCLSATLSAYLAAGEYTKTTVLQSCSGPRRLQRSCLLADDNFAD